MNDLLDEDVLFDALAEQAGRCPTAVAGSEGVLAAAAKLEVAHPRAGWWHRFPRLLSPARSHPILALAASLTAVVLAVAGLGIADVTTPSPTNAPVAAAHAKSAAGGASSNFSAGLEAPTTPSALTPQSSTNSASPSTGQGSGSTSLGGVPLIGPVVVSTGQVTVVVAKGGFTSAMSRMSGLASGAGGFISQSQTDTENGSPSGTLTLRVPSASFQSVLKAVEALGKTTSTTTSSQDQTSQYVDLTARITALQDTESQFESILAQATSISDIISVETQIGDLQTQIEQLQGQQQVLSDQASYATLTVNVSEQGAPPPPHPRSGIAQAWHDAVSGFVAAGEGIVSASGAIAFGLICLVVLILVGRPVIRRWRRRIV
ncbi:MAG: DUF4349 domain-containing protein [Acidimicrobiales bacterium]